MAVRLSGKATATEREGSDSLLRLNGECTPSLTGTTPLPRSGHGTYLDWLRKVRLGHRRSCVSRFQLRPPWGPVVSHFRSHTFRGPQLTVLTFLEVSYQHRVVTHCHRLYELSCGGDEFQWPPRWAGDHTSLYPEQRPNSQMRIHGCLVVESTRREGGVASKVRGRPPRSPK